MDFLVPEPGSYWSFHISRRGILAVLGLPRRSAYYSRRRHLSSNTRSVVVSCLSMARECELTTVSNPWSFGPELAFMDAFRLAEAGLYLQPGFEWGLDKCLATKNIPGWLGLLPRIADIFICPALGFASLDYLG